MRIKTTLLTACLVLTFSGALMAGPGASRSDDDKKPGPAVPAGVEADYRLGAGDKLRIEVYKDAQLSQSVQIRPDGKITLPLVGDVVATGMTPIELHRSGVRDFAHHERVRRFGFDDDDRHRRVGDVFGQRLGQRVAQLDRKSVV